MPEIYKNNVKLRISRFSRKFRADSGLVPSGPR